MGIQTQTRTMTPRVVAIILLATVASSLKTTDTNTKAASPYTNCGCQCSNLQFSDKYNRKHGNCQSVDHTGAKWCYVQTNGNQRSTCQDLSYTSEKFPGTPWSYEACATPACGSNGGFNNGGSGFNNGGSGFNNGGSGFNNGGYNNGGYNNGGSTIGGSLTGGYNNGGSNGGYGSSNCRHTNCGSGSNSGSYGSGSSGFNSGSSQCRGSKCLGGSS